MMLSEYLHARIAEQLDAWHNIRAARSFEGETCPVCRTSGLSGDVLYHGDEVVLGHLGRDVNGGCVMSNETAARFTLGEPTGDPSELARLMAAARIVSYHAKAHTCTTSTVPHDTYGALFQAHQPCRTLRLLSLEYADRDDYNPDWRI